MVERDGVGEGELIQVPSLHKADLLRVLSQLNFLLKVGINCVTMVKCFALLLLKPFWL